jgi:fucose 4-O-acetylase-like acetyltransferase
MTEKGKGKRSLEDRNYNYGISLLRMLMCFTVILCHCWNYTNNEKYLLPFSMLRQYAVPVFMFMSFFLTQKNFIDKGKDYILNRIWKLIIPQIAWAVIYYITYVVIGIAMHVQMVNGITDLFWQIITGHSPALNATMWFQTNLIVISLIFFVVFYFFSENMGVAIIILLSIISLFLQYSGINYILFGGLRYELEYPLGRLAEMIPIATFGFIASRYKLVTLFKNNMKNLVLSGVLFVLFVILDHKLFVIPLNFQYAGIWKVLAGYSLTSFAYNCNFDALVTKFPFYSRLITKHTLGIYCGHRLIATILFGILSVYFGIETYMFYQCILIYVLGFVLFEIFSKLPIKWIKYIC